MYRIVELPDPGIADYLKAQYFDDQSFDLTSPKTKTKDGWLVFDNTTGTEYVQKGDGLYYEVTDGLPAEIMGDVNISFTVDVADLVLLSRHGRRVHRHKKL